MVMNRSHSALMRDGLVFGRNVLFTYFSGNLVIEHIHNILYHRIVSTRCGRCPSLYKVCDVLFYIVLDFSLDANLDLTNLAYTS